MGGRLTLRGCKAVKAVPVILVWVRLRLHRLVRRPSRGRAASLMAALCANEREVSEGMTDRIATPTSVTLPPQISRDSSF